MLHRVFSAFIPAFVALACLSGAPAYGTDATQAASPGWSVAAAEASSARPALSEETNENGLISRFDDQDDPDRIGRISSTVCWPLLTPDACCRLADPAVIRAYRACAAPSTGPPNC